MAKPSFNSFYYILAAFKKAYNEDKYHICNWTEYNKAIKMHLKAIKRCKK